MRIRPQREEPSRLKADVQRSEGSRWVEMVIHDVSIYSIIKRNARLRKERTALISGPAAVSYHELLGKVDSLATGLQARGLKSGERIGVLAKNSLEYVYLYGAAARIGAILLPINWRLSYEEVKYVLSDGSPAVLFADPEFQDKAGPLISGVDSPITCFSTGDPYGDFRAFSELMEEGEATPVAKVGSDDRCVIIHTAAVQGRPRGAILTHRGVLLTSLELMYLWNLSPKDVNISMLPLFHIAGILQIVSVMMAGGCSIVLPGFDADIAVKCIEEHHVTVFFEFPPMLQSLLDKAQEDSRDLSCLRHVLGLDHPDTVKRFQDITGATFWAIYGQSETSGLTTAAPYFEKAGSAGVPLRLAEVEVVDDSGAILEPGRSGEIVVRGPQVFAGYWNLEEDTRYTLRDGWHHTGDMGRIDEQGYLWFEGRAPEKELIKPGGENVYPFEVENVILQHPKVKEVAVIGVPDPEWGEAIKAICALTPGSSLPEAELIQFVAGRIARFKKPKHVVYVDELPKTGDGRIDRGKIKTDHGHA